MSDLSDKLAGLSPEKLELLRRKLAKDQAGLKDASLITKRPAKDDLPLSFAQERLWFFDQLLPGNSLYNIAAAVKFNGELNVEVLEKSINLVVKRHEILRISYKTEKGNPQQVLHSELKISLNHFDLSDISAEEIEEKINGHAQLESQFAFDLSKTPLIRATLLKISEQVHVLILNIHHIVFDGWSMRNFISETARFYTSTLQKNAISLPEIDLQYADYSYWQKNNLDKKRIARQLSYWVKELEGMPAVLELPLDYPRSSLQTFKGEHYNFDLPIELSSKLKKFSKDHGVTQYANLFSAFQVFLHLFSRQDDFGIGIPINGRNKSETHPIIGLFVNSAVIRATFNDTLTFTQLLEQTKDKILSAYDNQDVPFEQVVEAALPKRDVSISPLFQVLFELQGDPLEGLNFENISLSQIDFETGTAKFDLILIMEEGEDYLKGVFEYNSDLFNCSTLELLSKYFISLLEQIVENPQKQISDYTLINKNEQERLLNLWAEAKTDYAKEKSVVQIFEEQVKNTPEAAALIFEDRELSYAELDMQATQLARFFVHNGIVKDDHVALYMERSIDMIVSFLAILKAGAVYVPLDTSYPKERITFMLQDAGAKVLLTHEKLLTEIPETNTTVICIDKQWKTISEQKDIKTNLPVTTGDDKAYIIYTSGSTGKPKGVVIPHRAINRLVLNTDYIKIKSGDRISQASNASFDAATFEIWGALLNGATLIGIPKEVMLSTVNYINEIQNRKISVLFITTALFNLVVNEKADAFKTIKTLLFGGEAVDPKSVYKVFSSGPPTRFLHMYGPTENATYSTWFKIDAIDPKAGTVPIGIPVANSSCYVLDKNRKLLPALIPGELYVGGDGLATGYHNRPELTEQFFVKNPIKKSNDNIIYKTGDLVRRLPSGNIEFMGRIDQQVKIRGFRIELGEIESVLKNHDKVNDAAVLARKDKSGDKQLIAYMVAANGSKIETSEIKQFMLKELPDYMVPLIYVNIKKIPLTPNGKLDKKALPEPDLNQSVSDELYIPARNKLEEFFVDLWQEVLDIKRIGVYDNFFDIGGNSLKAAVMVNRLQDVFDQTIHVGIVFQAPTIAEFAMYGKEYFSAALEKRFGKDLGSGDDYFIESDSTVKKLEENDLQKFRSIIEPLGQPETRYKDKQKNPRAIFLLSPPRSGSTLLRIMLAGNKQLFSPPELDLLSFNSLGERNKFFKDTGMLLWLEATQRALMEIQGIDYEQAQHIMDSCEKEDMSCKQFYSLMQKDLNGKTLIDKTPSYSLDLNILKRAEEDFDRPIYIHLARHPYAMIYSFIEAKLDDSFFKYDNPFTRQQLAELIWIESHNNISTFLNDIPDDRKISARFEDILVQPEHELRRLCQTLNVDFDPAMLKPYEGKKMTDGVKKSSQMVGDFKFYIHKDINKSVVDRWKKYHTNDFLSDMSWQIADTFGYPVEKNVHGTIEKAKKVELPPITKIDRGNKLPLSFAQQRLWFLDQLEPGKAFYNVPFAVRMQGNIDRSIIKKCLNEITKRHESLRTTFKKVDGQPHVHLEPYTKIVVEEINLENSTDLNEQIKSITNEAASQPFDLETGPLARYILIIPSKDECILIAIIHHIVSDGWSLSIFTKEMVQLYKAFANNEKSPLPELDIQYTDYAAWQRKWLTDNIIQSQLSFWKNYLQNAPLLLEIQTDRPRPLVQTYNGEQIKFVFSESVTKKLHSLCKVSGVTMFTTLMATIHLLMSRYSRQDDICIGTPIAGRNRSETENLFGFFVNTLIIRTDLSKNPSFKTLVRQLQTDISQTFDNQDIPFERLVDELSPNRNLSYSPLFQVMFTLQPNMLEKMEIPGLTLSPLQVESGTSKFDMTITMVEKEGRLRGQFEYNTYLYDSSTIERMITHLEELLASITSKPDELVKQLNIVPPRELELIKRELTGFTEPFKSGQCTHHYFEDHAKKTPQAIALKFQDQQYTYSELNYRANQLAHHLQKEGVVPDMLVGLYLERSVDIVVAVLAIIKAGGAYLPIDPVYPAERLNFMLEDSNTKIIITQSTLLENLPVPEIKTFVFDRDWESISNESVENPGVDITPENLIYCIYTSGSTGKPKGTLITHRNVVRLFKATEKWYNFTDKDVWLLFHSIAFDFSVWELWGALLYGAKLVIPSYLDTRSPESLYTLISNEEITVLNQTPSAFRQFLSTMEFTTEEQKQLAVRFIIFGGEALDLSSLKPWFEMRSEDSTQLINMYGITETTVHVTYREITRQDVEQNKGSLIGRPIPDLQVYILDEQKAVVPIGVAGELCVAGAGLAREYLERPELTEEKFIENPFSSNNERLYCSGDLARFLPDGDIEYLGRIDSQIKIRGFRIELGEIESVLRSYPQLSEVAVTVHDSVENDKKIIAYVCFNRDKTPTIQQLREHMLLSVPDYMTPSAFIFMDKLPLTSNGKLNYKALPEPEMKRDDLGSEFIAADKDNEKKLSKIWCDILGIDKVGIRDNFFELGGDSILSIQVIARANQAGLVLSPKQLFENPTIEKLSLVAGKGTVINAEQGLVKGSSLLTPIQHWFFEKELPNYHHWNQSLMLETEQSLDTRLMEKVIQKISESHDVFRLQFKKEKNGWQQSFTENIEMASLEIIDLSSSNDANFNNSVVLEANRLQASLNITTGPLARFAYIKSPDSKNDLLLIIVHHLIIDGISWRIITDGIQTLYDALQNDKKVQLPPKSTSYKYWAEQLTKFALSEELSNEAQHWFNLNTVESSMLKIKNPDGNHLESDFDFVSLSLDENSTSLLLQEAPSTYNTQINDLLLTALIQAFGTVTGRYSLLLHMEGHGREDLFDDVDISRTLGWFTSIFPLHLDITGKHNTGESIKTIKEQIRQVPAKGIGFGLLKYLGKPEIKKQINQLPKPQVIFNYLGQYDTTNKMGNFKPIQGLSGSDHDPNGKIDHLLDITGSVLNGELNFRIFFSREIFDLDTIQAFADTYIKELKTIIDHCIQTEDGGYTPSDFEEADINQDDLDNIMSELDDLE